MYMDFEDIQIEETFGAYEEEMYEAGSIFYEYEDEEEDYDDTGPF